MNPVVLDARMAAGFAAAAIGNICQAFPQRVDATMVSDQALPAVHLQHPAFHGSFDWHSCVHMHWLLLRLLQLVPQQPWQGDALRLLNQRLSVANLQAELAAFALPENRLFERPYGWAWLLKLGAIANQLPDSLPAARQWAQALQPLATLLADRLEDYLRQLAFPVRAGTHGNTAFAMLLALDFQSPALSQCVRERALGWFIADRCYPAAYEPDGEDFLSGGLTEAALMSRLLPDEQFQDWWSAFRPDSAGSLRWQEPVRASSTTDGRLVHLAGLNLSRAWCMRLIARKLPTEARQMEAWAQRHVQASMPYVLGGDFAGEHWLASFATLALAP